MDLNSIRYWKVMGSILFIIIIYFIIIYYTIYYYYYSMDIIPLLYPSFKFYIVHIYAPIYLRPKPSIAELATSMQNMEVMDVILVSVKFMSNLRRAQRALSPCRL